VRDSTLELQMTVNASPLSPREPSHGHMRLTRSVKLVLETSASDSRVKKTWMDTPRNPGGSQELWSLGSRSGSAEELQDSIDQNPLFKEGIDQDTGDEFSPVPESGLGDLADHQQSALPGSIPPIPSACHQPMAGNCLHGLPSAALVVRRCFPCTAGKSES